MSLESQLAVLLNLNAYGISGRYDDRAAEIIGYYNEYKGYNRKKSYKRRGKKKSERKVTGIYESRKKWKQSNKELFQFFAPKNTVGIMTSVMNGVISPPL